MTKLSALILTHNEGPTIRGVVENVLAVLRGIDPDAQVVVVDGASTDGTAANAAAGGAVVHQQRQKGYGAAFREGLQHVRSDYVVTLDADLSHPPEFVNELWSRRFEADIVVASRYTAGGSAALSLFRRLLSHFMNGVYRAVLQLPIADLSSGYRLYRRAAVAPIELQSNDFDILVELLVLAWSRGCPVLEIPFHFEPRQHGESHLRVVKFGMSYGRTLLRLASVRHSAQSADYDLRARGSVLALRWLWAWRRRRWLQRGACGLVLDLGGAASVLGVNGTLVLPADASVQRLEQVKRPGLRVDPQRLPMADDSVETVVVSSAAFDLREVHRVLVPGGHAMLLTDRLSPRLAGDLRDARFVFDTHEAWPGRDVVLAHKMPAGWDRTVESPSALTVLSPVRPGGRAVTVSVTGLCHLLCPRCRHPLSWDGQAAPPPCPTCAHAVPRHPWGFDLT